MSFSAEFGEYVTELLAPLGGVRIKRMFGGGGVYVDEVFVAIIIDDVLYLKADEHNRAEFAAAGSEAFVYTAKGRSVTLGFWRAPDEAMDSPALMQAWARSALAAALRAKKPPPAQAAAKPRSRRK